MTNIAAYMWIAPINELFPGAHLTVWPTGWVLFANAIVLLGACAGLLASETWRGGLLKMTGQIRGSVILRLAGGIALLVPLPQLGGLTGAQATILGLIWRTMHLVSYLLRYLMLHYLVLFIPLVASPFLLMALLTAVLHALSSKYERRQLENSP